MQEISSESSKSISALQRLFKRFLNNPPKLNIQPHNNCRLIIDATHFGQKFCLVNCLDSDLKYLQFYSLAEQEDFGNFLSDLEQLKVSGLQAASITSDGKQGLIKAVKQVFPETVHQRCIIHVQRMSLIYLTRFPKTEAGRTLRILVVKLHEINSYQRQDIWIKLFNRLDWKQVFLI